MNRLPTICLQALSTTPDPTGNPRSRRRSRRIRSLLASKQPTQAATALSRPQCGSGSAMARSTRPLFNCVLILSIRAFHSPLSGARARIAAAAQSRAWNWSRVKVVLMPTKISSQTFRIQAASEVRCPAYAAADRTLSMKHASFQRAGNKNMEFRAIVEYPFFTCSARPRRR